VATITGPGAATSTAVPLSFASSVPKVTYTYNGYLPITESWSGPVTGSIQFGYDKYLKPITKVATIGSFPSTVNYSLDADGMVTCASTASNCGSLANDLKAQYNGPNLRLSNVTVGNASEALGYDSFGALASQTAMQGTTNLLQMTYVGGAAQRDNMGRIKTKVETWPDATNHTFNYTYDPLGRLTQVTDTQGATTTTTESYTYDNDGNRLTEINTPASNPALYDAQDRLNAFWTGDGHTWSFTYTDDGSLSTRVDNTSGLSEQLTYDGLGNLTQVKLLNGTTITSTIDYIVDGKGRRIGKKVNGTLKKQWIYDGQLRIVAELTTNGSTNTMTRFVYGSRTNTPELMLKYTSPGATPTAYRIFSDHLGSPRVVVNAANVNDVLLKVHYSAFGIPTLEGGSLDAVPMGFAGGLFDPDTALVRFGARDYDARFGRWVSKDPILFKGRQGNLYVYAHNDPINFIDPTGTDELLTVAAASMFAGGAAMVLTPASVVFAVGALNWWNPVGWGLIAAGVGLGIYSEWDTLSSLSNLDWTQDKLKPVDDSNKRQMDQLKELDRLQKDQEGAGGNCQ